MNVESKYGIPNLSNLSKIFHENEILSKKGGGGSTPQNPSESTSWGGGND